MSSISIRRTSSSITSSSAPRLAAPPARTGRLRPGPAAGDDADYNRTPDDGRHRSHRFIASNGMMPRLLELEGWQEQLELTEKWLRGDYEIPEIADKWAEGPVVRIDLEVPDSAAPGTDVPVRVVLTSNKVGHDYPTGPLDIIQSWLEVRMVDAAGRVCDWNQQAARMFGWTRSEIMGRTLTETVVPPRYRESHQRGLARRRHGDPESVLGRTQPVGEPATGGHVTAIDPLLDALASLRASARNDLVGPAFDRTGDGQVDLTIVDRTQDGNPDEVIKGDGGLPPTE